MLKGINFEIKKNIGMKSKITLLAIILMIGVILPIFYLVNYNNVNKKYYNCNIKDIDKKFMD